MQPNIALHALFADFLSTNCTSSLSVIRLDIVVHTINSDFLLHSQTALWLGLHFAQLLVVPLHTAYNTHCRSHVGIQGWRLDETWQQQSCDIPARHFALPTEAGMRTVAITTYETESWCDRQKCSDPFDPRLSCCSCTGQSNVADWCMWLTDADPTLLSISEQHQLVLHYGSSMPKLQHCCHSIEQLLLTTACPTCSRMFLEQTSCVAQPASSWWFVRLLTVLLSSLPLSSFITASRIQWLGHVDVDVIAASSSSIQHLMNCVSTTSRHPTCKPTAIYIIKAAVPTN